MKGNKMKYQIRIIEGKPALYVIREAREPINNYDGETLPEDLKIVGITNDFAMVNALPSGEYIGETWHQRGEPGDVNYESESIRAAYAQYVARGGAAIQTFFPEEYHPAGYRFNTADDTRKVIERHAYECDVLEKTHPDTTVYIEIIGHGEGAYIQATIDITDIAEEDVGCYDLYSHVIIIGTLPDGRLVADRPGGETYGNAAEVEGLDSGSVGVLTEWNGWGAVLPIVNIIDD